MLYSLSARVARRGWCRYSSAVASVPFDYVQSGQANLVATLVDNTTRFTELSHKAPSRWIPVSQGRTVPAVATLGHYGGGMTAGDGVKVKIRVEAGASVQITTQGTNRVYKQRVGVDTRCSEQQYDVQVESGATCVITPDPTQLQAGSMYQQTGRFDLQDETSSLVLVDWISAGRLTAGERWQHAFCQLQTEIRVGDKLVVADTQSLDDLHDTDWASNLQFHAVGSIFLHNVPSEAILRLQSLQKELCRPHTAVRDSCAATTCKDAIDLSILSGRVILGVSEVNSNMHVVRFAASTNEDVYRIIHWALQPLGLYCYRERITAHRSAPPIHVIAATNYETTEYSADLQQPEQQQQRLSGLSSKAMWAALMLSDSNFPTGAFAHSSGLEAAYQLGLVDSKSVPRFLQAIVQSSVNQAIPLIRSGYSNSQNVDEWNEVDAVAHAVLSTNAPACHASIDQGRNLLRVVTSAMTSKDDRGFYDGLQAGHVAPLWGVVAQRTFGLDEEEACSLYAFTVARDVISAAVRLNLVGPLEGQSILQKVAVRIPAAGAAAMTSAPVLEAVHPCHAILATRLFRT